VVIEILVALAQTVKALAQQRDQRMSDLGWIARVGQPFGQSGRQLQPAVGLTHHQQPALTGDIPTGETGLNAAAIAALTPRPAAVTTGNSNDVCVQTVTAKPPWLNGLNTIAYSDFQGFRHFF
jgi:hypothetical protein